MGRKWGAEGSCWKHMKYDKEKDIPVEKMEKGTEEALHKEEDI